MYASSVLPSYSITYLGSGITNSPDLGGILNFQVIMCQEIEFSVVITSLILFLSFPTKFRNSPGTVPTVVHGTIIDIGLFIRL